MTCIIQEPRNRFFLTESGAWTSNINDAVEFQSVHQTLEHKQRLQLSDATVLIFRGKSVYRLDSHAANRVSHEDPLANLFPVDEF